ncbi:MAG TPA: DUF4412 domain-containing protein [Polyangiaceae bacterium]
MARLPFLALVLALALAACKGKEEEGTVVPTPFEGTITLRLDDPGKAPDEVVYEIKGDKFRVALPPQTNGGRQGYIVFDSGTKQAILALDDRKTWTTVDLSKGGIGAPALPSLGTASPSPDLVGKHEVVAGYRCEAWGFAGDEANTSICVVKGVPWFTVPNAAPNSPVMKDLASGKMFPLRMVVKSKDGVVRRKMEATKIEPGPIAEGRMSVPPDYRKIDIAEMMSDKK